MVRALLAFAAVIGALVVIGMAADGNNPAKAMQAAGIGVGILIFMVGLGLADLIELAHRTRGSISALDDTLSEVRDGVERLRWVLTDRIAPAKIEEIDHPEE
jgi:hypothetical protein